MTDLFIQYDVNNLTETDIVGFSNGIQANRIDSLQIDLFPVRYSIALARSNIGLSFGVSYLRLFESTKAILNDSEGVFLFPAGQYVTYFNDRNAFLVSPRFGFDLLIRPNSLVKLGYNGYICPIYYLSLDQSIYYDFLPTYFNNSITRWSSPYFDHSLSLELFNLIRGIIQYGYQRLDFQTMDWDQTGESLIGYDDVQEIKEIRFGVELLVPIKAGQVRFKGGVFWENYSNDSSYWGEIGNNSKLLFSFGIEG